MSLDAIGCLIGIGMVVLVGVGLTLPMYLVWNHVIIGLCPPANLQPVGLGGAFGLSVFLGMIGKSGSK